MALNFGLLDQGGPTNFFEGYSQGQEKMQANAMAQKRAAQAQQEFGMRQQEFAAGQAEKKRVSDTARVTQKLASFKDALLRAPNAKAAGRIVQLQYDDSDLGPLRRQFGSLQDALAEIPEETTAFQKYIEDEAMGMEEARKQRARDRAFNIAETGPSATMAAAPAPTAMAAAAPVVAAVAPMFQPSTPRPMPKVGDSYPYTYMSGPKEGTTETRIVTQADLDQARDYRGSTVQLPPDLTAMPAPVANAMAPVPTPAAAAVTNAMAPAPTPAAAPVGELERLTAQRNRYSKISPQTPGDVAKLKNILDGIDEQIKRLTTTGSSLSKLIAERDRLPPGDSRIATYDDAIKKESQNVAKAEPLADFAAFMRLSTAEQDAFLKFKRAAAGNVTATATTGSVAKSLSAPVGQRVETSLIKAEGATSMMDTANSVREALNAGNVIAGPLAGVRTKFAQLLELAGAGDKEKLVNTRTAIQGLAGLTLESRAELKGQGQITDTETKLLEKARSADVGDLTIPELQQVVNVSQRLASRLYGNHQILLDRMKGDPAAKDSMRYYEPTGTLAKPLLESKTPAAQSKDEKRPSLGSIFGNPPQGVK